MHHLLSEPLIQIEPIAGNQDLEDPDPISMDPFYVPRHAQGLKGFDEIPPGGTSRAHFCFWGNIPDLWKIFLNGCHFQCMKLTPMILGYVLATIVVSYDNIKKTAKKFFNHFLGL